MAGIRRRLSTALARTETFLDSIKLTYKWRFNRFFNLNVLPYRGFGTRERVWFRGRVLDDRTPTSGAHDTVWQNVATTLRRIETDEIPGATVRVKFYDQVVEVETDEDGFFDVWIEPGEIDVEQSWHPIEVDLLRPHLHSGEPVNATGQILIPPEDAAFGIISDLDDTVVRSGAYNRLQMGRVVLLNNASSRTPFPGVSTFYQALQRGRDERGANPIFYVSSSPWNLYTLFDDFMAAHDIPAGPILLRDYGFYEDRSFFGSHRSHKNEQFGNILQAYPNLPFVLIGDSGQRDPEICREVVQSHPGRIRAIFIRDVTPPRRDEEVHRIAEEVESLGVPMALVQDSSEAAEKARELGLIADDVVSDVKQKQSSEAERRPRGLLSRLLG